jgi:hypothetical protein
MNNLQLKLRILGVYQMFGGLVGIFLTLLIVSFSNISDLLLALFILLLFGYSIYCGLLLIGRSKKGLQYSKVNQILQAVHFTILGYGFKYVSGLFFSLGFDLTDGFSLEFYFGISNWLMDINADNVMMSLHVNFVALFLIALIVEETIRTIGQDSDPVAN